VINPESHYLLYATCAPYRGCRFRRSCIALAIKAKPEQVGWFKEHSLKSRASTLCLRSTSLKYRVPCGRRGADITEHRRRRDKDSAEDLPVSGNQGRTVYHRQASVGCAGRNARPCTKAGKRQEEGSPDPVRRQRRSPDGKSAHPALPRRGWYITYNVTAAGETIYKNDPRIDDLIVQEDNIIPPLRTGFDEYWKKLGEGHDKVVTLIEVLEGDLLRVEGSKEFNDTWENGHSTARRTTSTTTSPSRSGYKGPVAVHMAVGRREGVGEEGSRAGTQAVG